MSLVADNDNTQTNSSDAMHLPTTTNLTKENFPDHPLYIYINDILTNSISLPAHHLLNSLVITGAIPLPLFYVEELNNVVMNAVPSQEKKKIQAESPMKELLKFRVIRSSSCPVVYHKDLNPDYIDTTVQSMIVPQLICGAVKNQMDVVDKALSILSVQHALENLLMNETISLIHLRYILILCNHLDDVCSHVSDHLFTINLNRNFKFWRCQDCNNL